MAIEYFDGRKEDRNCLDVCGDPIITKIPCYCIF